MDPSLQFSRSEARSLEEFSDAFKSALVLSEGFSLWADELGYLHSVEGKVKTTWPLPIDAAGYREFKGDFKYRHLYARELTMKTKTWHDGVEEFLSKVQGPNFAGWGDAPANMALEWRRLPNTICAEMLAVDTFNGPLLDLYRDPDTEVASTRRLFANDHPFNVLMPSFGTFQNYTTTTVAAISNGTFFDAVDLYFGDTLRGANGQTLGLMFLNGGRILVPPARVALFDRVLKSDTMINAITNAGAQRGTSNVVAAVGETNRYKGISYVVGHGLTSADYIYCLPAQKPGLYPWIVQQQSTPEEIVHDQSSAKYKDTLKIAVSEHGEANVAAAMPQAIYRVQITG